MAAASHCVGLHKDIIEGKAGLATDDEGGQLPEMSAQHLLAAAADMHSIVMLPAVCRERAGCFHRKKLVCTIRVGFPYTIVYNNTI